MIFITRLIGYTDYNSFSGCDVVVSAQMAPINNGDAMKTHVLGSLQTISYSTHQDRAPVRSIGNINAIDYVQGQRTIAGTMVFAMFHEHWMTPLLEELSSHVSNTDIWSDELPALNLTISMANEYGYKSNMVLYGVKFIDDGGVLSINDLFTENTLQYVATGIQPLKTSGQYEHSATQRTKIDLGAISSIKEIIKHKKYWTKPEPYEKSWPNFRDIVIDNMNTPVAKIRDLSSLKVVIDPPLEKEDFDIKDSNPSTPSDGNTGSIPGYTPPATNPEDNPSSYPVYSDNNDTAHKTYAVYIYPEISTDKPSFRDIILQDVNKPNNNNNGSDNGRVNEEYLSKVPGEDIWYTEIQKGLYDIILETDEGVRHKVWTLIVSQDNAQNNVTLTTDFYEKPVTEKVTIHPVICGVGNTSIVVAPNAIHDQLEVKKVIDTNLENEFLEQDTTEVRKYEINSDSSINRSYSKEILIEDLEPDTKYVIRSLDSVTNSYSSPTLVRTLTVKEDLPNKLNSFISTNSDILVNKDLNVLDYNLKSEYYNLLDAIINVSGAYIEPEMLLYACVLQNKVNDVYNDCGININNANYISNILDNTYFLNEIASEYAIFKKVKTKHYYVLKELVQQQIEYTGKINTHYYIQPISDDNKKIPRVDFVSFTAEQQQLLQKYSTVKSFEDLALLSDSYKYASYNNNLINAIKAVDNFISHRVLLESPTGTMYNNVLYVNTSYKDKKIDEDLYLCIADPYEVINNFPIIKIPLDDQPYMALDKFQTLILNDSYYLLWIQDSSFNNVSLPSIVSTYSSDSDYINYCYHRNEEAANSILDMFSPDSVYLSYIDTATDVILSEEASILKDIKYTIVQSLLLLFEDDMVTRALDDIIYAFVDTCLCNQLMEAKFIRKDHNITFSCAYEQTAISAITITQNNIVKEHYTTTYDLSLYNEGYTLLFLSNFKYNIKSNALIINNTTKQIFASNIDLEVIGNGR